MSFGKSLEGKSTINSAEEIGALVQYEFRVNHLLLLKTSYYIFCVHLKQKVTPNCDVLFWQITNLGRSLKYFSNASLNIFWPKENSVGKWLLCLTQISSKGVQSVPCSPVNEINPLKDVKVTHASAF